MHCWYPKAALIEEKLFFSILKSIVPGSITAVFSYIQQSQWTAGIFLAILGKGPRAFLVGKFSDVNPEFGKFSKYSPLIIFSNVTYLDKVFHLESLNNNL